MKAFIASSFLLAAAESARVLRNTGSSKFILREYLFNDDVDKEGRRELDGIPSDQPMGYRQYELKEVIDVEGRQGVATNGTHYFVSDSLALYVYDMDGNMLQNNTDPFNGLEKPANHFGDIGYYKGNIYTGVEWFEDGRGHDIQIIVYDSETLERKEAFPWDPNSGQVEVSALTVDTNNDLVWMTDWVSSNYIYSYDVESGAYTGKLHLRATPTWTQGIAFYQGDLYITADDGNADRREHDNLWRVPKDTLLNNATYIRHELEFTVPDHFTDFGEIEGLDFNKDNGEMIVLSNRGKRIVLGTPMGLYPGYDKEIHELFVFRIVGDDDDKEASKDVVVDTNITDTDAGDEDLIDASSSNQDSSTKGEGANTTDAGDETLDDVPSSATSRLAGFVALVVAGAVVIIH
mmetsp:Transcript_54415/g.115590  ORF Transcript_54415/g.115590 Transcript_54415/m.115590 type:complete len:405 (-) Transcript_54415:83-1297(-)|eukprot:CAMPEP_0172544828 /NCGR_PEP_ID=MMETSP1067-20121228/14892_1 /TAXON_ID=265564 ORGANISM="Thalassiosira punctigera, Strain Tpunct2005C2" /NCGR_SAMPLE_ID=MMETSP1067 /ASSEMBLY_ACC=CAM_ASM_000444 /LENGTH=404 /DNA_ID=CAMNT_0013331453 /DNA_START=200 /DNA_END=1414 /DNA_ORIENTATION=+